MPRQPRPNPRRRIDQLAREAARAVAERRDAVLPSDLALNEAAAVTRSDVDRALAFAADANRGSPIESLLAGPPGEAERDG